MKTAVIATLVAGATAFTPVQRETLSTALFNGPVIGAGGMADTRDPDAFEDEDLRRHRDHVYQPSHLHQDLGR